MTSPTVVRRSNRPNGWGWLSRRHGDGDISGAPGAAQADAAGQPAHLGPRVLHTDTGPTGYEVTFRFYAPQAKRVQIKGEWYFENPSTLPQLAPAAPSAASRRAACASR